jgi:hypothetical protein
MPPWSKATTADARRSMAIFSSSPSLLCSISNLDVWTELNMRLLIY